MLISRIYYSMNLSVVLVNGIIAVQYLPVAHLARVGPLVLAGLIMMTWSCGIAMLGRIIAVIQGFEDGDTRLLRKCAWIIATVGHAQICVAVLYDHATGSNQVSI